MTNDNGQLLTNERSAVSRSDERIESSPLGRKEAKPFLQTKEVKTFPSQDELGKMDNETLRKTLMTLPGVGRKQAKHNLQNFILNRNNQSRAAA